MNQIEISPRIIYIAGYGRSGSTLLDVLFGNHPAMFGAGELSAFFLEWAGGGHCSCGQLYAECEFWSQVIRRLHAGWAGLTPQAAEQITRKVEAPSLRRFSPADQAEDIASYRRLWGLFIAAIRQESGKEIIVDSSKNSLPSLRRIEALEKLAGCEVQAIHLVRDPRATMWSALRSSDQRVDMGHQQRSRAGGAYRALLGWGISNLSVHLTALTDRRVKLTRVRYEDLVTQPVQVLQRLGAFLNLDLAPVVDGIVKSQPFDPGHGVKGNRMRRRGPVSLRLDEEWKISLPTSARLLAPLSWPLASRYGYNVLR